MTSSSTTHKVLSLGKLGFWTFYLMGMLALGISVLLT